MAATDTITTTISIARTPDEVYDFVTTAANWPKFWPLTVRVEGVTDRPLHTGEQVTEHVWVGPWRGRFVWTAEEVQRPHHYLLTGTAITEDLPRSILTLLRDVPCRIEYTITADGTNTRFERVMSFPIVGWQGWLSQRFGFGADIDRLVHEALLAAKEWLENPLLRAPAATVTDLALVHDADPLADAAVASLVPPSGDLQALETFLGSFYRGLASTNPPTPEMARYLRETSTLPPWASPARIQVAQQLFLDWGTLVFASLVCAGLPETYTFKSIARLLDRTGQLDLDAMHVRRRLAFTLRMIFDVMAVGGLSAGGRGVSALQRIRLIHAVVRLLVQSRFASSSRLAQFSTVEWDAQDGQPINQAELLYTLMTFSHVVLRSLTDFGCVLTPFEQESYVHAWNVAGALLGVREELLPHDVADAARIFDQLKAAHGGPSPAGARLAQSLGPYFSSQVRLVPARTGLELMQHVTTRLLDPTTIQWLELDRLPDLPWIAEHVLTRLGLLRSRVLSDAYGDLADTGRAAAALVAMLVHVTTADEEQQSGLSDIASHLFQTQGPAAPQ
jgi:uncharacterized protein YndB with AHSA1/START domain